MGFEDDACRSDFQFGNRHAQFELHLMDLHRFRVTDDVEAWRLHIGDGAPDEQLLVGDLVDTRFVLPGMNEVEIVVGWK